jgi:Common central domain of tyrosinase
MRLDTIHAVNSLTCFLLSAFDPIFYLHHCNVDRILAFWEYVYSDYWMGDGYRNKQGDLVPFSELTSTYSGDPLLSQSCVQHRVVVLGLKKIMIQSIRIHHFSRSAKAIIITGTLVTPASCKETSL